MQTVDGTQAFRDAIKRIQELERLNKSLAEQVDRQAQVVEAVLPWKYTFEKLLLINLVAAINNYEQRMDCLMKDGAQ